MDEKKEYIRLEFPKVWKSLKTGNEFPYSDYANIDEEKFGKKCLPKDEYHYTIVYEKRPMPEWYR